MTFGKLEPNICGQDGDSLKIRSLLLLQLHSAAHNNVTKLPCPGAAITDHGTYLFFLPKSQLASSDNGAQC